jgi:hypothetical protein
LHGNYYTLRGGFANEGMMDLTGSPTECFDFEETQVIDSQIKTGDLFRTMKKYDELGYLISASTPGEDKWTEEEEKPPEGGLVPGHAYSVIQVKEYNGN